MSATPKRIDAADLALRILTSQGTSAYVAYLVAEGDAASVVAEIAAELHVLDEQVTVERVPPSRGAAGLLHDLPSITANVLLIAAESYEEEDWRLLDRRRSTLAREGVTVFVTTESSFTLVMRVAPNLASWLAGLIFSHEQADVMSAEHREQRLGVLRAWAGKTDAEIVVAAGEGSLPRDPEYAEWLVLIGRGDLLDAR